MRLIVSGQQSPVARSASLGIEIEVTLETVFAVRQRLVFVDVYFKWILRGHSGRATKQNCQQIPASHGTLAFLKTRTAGERDSDRPQSAPIGDQKSASSRMAGLREATNSFSISSIL